MGTSFLPPLLADFWSFPLFPERASSMAGEVDAVFFLTLAVAVGFTAFVLALVIFLLVRYRAGTKVNRIDPPESSFWLEAAWIGVPLGIAVVMFVAATVVFFRMYEPPGDAYEVNVVGKQWMFYLQHPEGKREISELHIPVGKPVKLNMTSQDVIHSFFIPAFRTKQDLVPGRYTSMWFTPTKVGVYHLFCAEYCGTNHSVMGGTIYVMEPTDYEDWLDEGNNGLSLAKQGEVLFQQHHCGGCHGGSQAVKAPYLDGVYGSQVPIMRDDKSVYFQLADDRYIRDSILLPKTQVVAGYEPLMPSFKDRLSEEDLLKIVAYIKSIGSSAGVKAKEASR